MIIMILIMIMQIIIIIIVPLSLGLPPRCACSGAPCVCRGLEPPDKLFDCRLQLCRETSRWAVNVSAPRRCKHRGAHRVSHLL